MFLHTCLLIDENESPAGGGDKKKSVFATSRTRGNKYAGCKNRKLSSAFLPYFITLVIHIQASPLGFIRLHFFFFSFSVIISSGKFTECVEELWGNYQHGPRSSSAALAGATLQASGCSCMWFAESNCLCFQGNTGMYRYCNQ